MPKASILIVEDEQVVGLDLRSNLENCGYRVAGQADRGEDVLQKAEALHPDLVLMDIGLKGEMDGIEAATQIRASLNLPVIFLTAFADEATLRRARPAEPYGYILKPFDERELAGNIEVALYRHGAEKKLREREERLRLALMAADQGLYDLNVQTGETIVSPEYARMLGYAPDEFVETNAKWRDRLHPDDREPVYRAYEEYLAGVRSEYRVEFRQQTKEGNWKWILSLGRVVAWDKERRPLRMLGTHTDISERKRTEEALRQALHELQAQNEALRQAQVELEYSRACYRDLFDLAPVGYLTLDDEELILEANVTAASLLGLPRSALVKQPITRFVLPEDQDFYVRRRKQLLETDVPQVFELRLTREQGSPFWAQWEASKTKNADGVPVCRAVVTDVTARKQAEAERQVALTKYRTLFEAFPLGITVSDAAGRILETNSIAEKLLGVSPAEQTERALDGPEWRIVRPDGTPMPAAEYASVRALTEKRLVENVEMGIVKSKDSTTWISVAAAPLPLENYGVVVVYGDITERKLREKAEHDQRQG